jgi:hypothetical protein
VGRSELQEIITFVPFYEVGTDFFTQCKPPYDGGYSTTMYEEFLGNRASPEVLSPAGGTARARGGSSTVASERAGERTDEEDRPRDVHSSLPTSVSARRT